MKKLIILLMVLIMALSMVFLVACSTNSTSQEIVSESEIVPEYVGEPDSTDEVEEELPERAEKLYIADAALYRGTVSNLVVDGDNITFTLTQADGTDFGESSMTFVITSDTQMSFDDTIKQELDGRYLEVFYAAASDDDNAVEAIAVNDYISEGMVIFNGTVIEINERDDKEGEGSILIEDKNNAGNQVAFNYGPQTQFYVDFNEIEVGDMLSVFHSPAMTMSIPAQSAAWEISEYED